MNRLNFGNQITNGTQILSVGGTTGAGFINQSRRLHLADASSALNNFAEQEGISRMDAAKQVGQYEADVLRSRMETFYNKGGENGSTGTDGVGDTGFSVDDIMSDTGLELDSPQAQNLEQKRKRDLEWYNTWVKGKRKMTNKFKSELMRYLRGGDDDAND